MVGYENMSRCQSRWAMTSLLMTAVATWGCGADSRDEASAGVTDVTAEAMARSERSGLQACYGTDPGAVAGGGWRNFAIPETTAATGAFTMEFSASPSGMNGGSETIDGVIGFSDGPADAFTDLGPIIQFNEAGGIAVRNGGQYEDGFVYRTGMGGFFFKLLIDLETHRYSAWVKNSNGVNKPYEVLGTDLAFRTEQANVAKLNHVGVFVDSQSGELQAPCSLQYEPPATCVSSDTGVWKSQPFAAQTDVFRLEFVATPSANDIDAVIGATQGTADAFSDLAAIVRFRPDGTIDARNGSVYAADATAHYSAGQPYLIALDIDRTNGTYSVGVTGFRYDPPIVIAHDYAFRTEQSSIASFDSLAQVMDQTPGSLQVCMLTLVK